MLIYQILTEDNISLVIKIIAYLLIFSGLIFIIRKDILKFYIWQKEYRLAKRKKVKVRKKESRLDRSLRILIASIFNVDHRMSVFYFKFLTISILLFFEIACLKQLPITQATFIAVIMSLMPYLFLRLRLIQIRNKSSGEAEQLVSDFLSDYRINNLNIEETIESVLHSKNIESTKPLLSKLLIKLRTTRSDIEILEATNVFAYTIGTNWAKMLASNIYQASRFGIDISLSLEDILINLREAKLLKEERIRNTSEPKRMMYFIPVSYILLSVISIYVIGLDFNQFVNNQFNTKEGLVVFCFCVFGTLISYLLISIINSKKLDF